MAVVDESEVRAVSEQELSQTALAYRALERTIRAKGDVNAAARFVMDAERVEGVDYERIPALYFFSSVDLGYVGAALLAGEGARIAEAVWRILRTLYKVDGEYQLISSIPESQYDGSDWLEVIWLRILADDRRPVPVRTITSCHYNITSAFWAAVCAGDRAGIERGIRALERIERRGKAHALSILGYALREQFPATPAADPTRISSTPSAL